MGDSRDQKGKFPECQISLRFRLTDDGDFTATSRGRIQERDMESTCKEVIGER